MTVAAGAGNATTAEPIDGGVGPASNPYGALDPATGEFVVIRPDTPTPWINYLGEGGFGGIVSNTGGGFAFDRDPRNRRVTRYRYNAIPADQPGRYVYLRDQESGDFWSPTWQPVKRNLAGYECRHGPGYTRIRGTHEGIEAELLYFVPARVDRSPVPHELWVMRIRNSSGRRRTIRAFTYAEFGYVDAASDQQNLDWSQHIVSCTYDAGVLSAGTRFKPTRAFFASTLPALGYTADREDFVGPGRDLANPIVVESGVPANRPSPRGNGVGSLCHELVLEPDEERRLVYVLGITDEPGQVAATVSAYRDPAAPGPDGGVAVDAVDAAFSALRDDWTRYLTRFSVETPDPEMNAMLNTWNQVQCRTTLHWSRFVSGYETGLGRGIGTRDGAQDTLGVLHTEPARARDLLTRLWRLQFRDGHTWHLFFPFTGEGGPGLAAEMPDFPQWFSDDHLWLVIASCAYVRETADVDWLESRVPWADGGDDTIWGHILRAVEFTRGNLGPHGLPRAGFADWDDTLNVDHGSGKAESVWTAMQFCRAMLDLGELAEHVMCDPDAFCGALGDRFAALHDEMAAAINAAAWDGRWYARAFDDDGRPIGVDGEPAHAINLNPQAWSILAELGDGGRDLAALREALERLETPYGVALLAPPYDGFQERVRGTSTYPPGAKENGGIFCHADAWVVVAAAMAGWNDDAYRIYREVLPLTRTDADRYRAEPYVYAQNICGPTHPQFGMARNAWLTGTAAWMYVAATQWILGIRPTYEGLLIAPAIPSAWPGFRARRVFRGTVYEIEVRRQRRDERAGLIVDGRPVEGRVVPLPPAGAERVAVEMVLP